MNWHDCDIWSAKTDIRDLVQDAFAVLSSSGKTGAAGGVDIAGFFIRQLPPPDAFSIMEYYSSRLAKARASV
ncbi:hypothetical protein [Paracoccus tibetensis]|uniref:hypothetical protein n=1 Tax=Paracoccus tibetensis TaxID=336292 RepID=UPI001114024F|nr:hypothetical protein [Paracoccus tibetensis]